MLTGWELGSMRDTVVGSFDATSVRQRWSTVKDEFNNDVRDDVTEVAVPCRLFQTVGSEVTDGRDTQVSDWSLHVPFGADLNGHDTVVVYPVLYADFDIDDRPAATGTFEVQGPPLVRSTHKRANLRNVA